MAYLKVDTYAHIKEAQVELMSEKNINNFCIYLNSGSSTIFLWQKVAALGVLFDICSITFNTCYTICYTRTVAQVLIYK